MYLPLVICINYSLPFSLIMVRPKAYKDEAEKATARAERERERQRTRVQLGDQMQRWRDVGISESLATNTDIARFLLDL